MRYTLDNLIKFALNKYLLYDEVTNSPPKKLQVEEEMKAAYNTLLGSEPNSMYIKSYGGEGAITYDGEEYHKLPEDFVSWAETPSPIVDSTFDGTNTLFKLSRLNVKYRYYVRESFEMYPEMFDATIALFLYNISPTYSSINVNKAQVEADRMRSIKRLQEKWNMERV